MMCLNLLATSSCVSSDSLDFQSTAQFKLFGLVSQLQKFNLPGSDLRKGYCKENETWIMRVTKLVSKILAAEVQEE